MKISLLPIFWHKIMQYFIDVVIVNIFTDRGGLGEGRWGEVRVGEGREIVKEFTVLEFTINFKILMFAMYLQYK